MVVVYLIGLHLVNEPPAQVRMFEQIRRQYEQNTFEVMYSHLDRIHGRSVPGTDIQFVNT